MCSSTVLNCVQQREIKRVADQSQVHVLSESRRVRFSTHVGSLTECASPSIMLRRLVAAELVHKVTDVRCKRFAQLFCLCLPKLTHCLFLFLEMDVNILGSRPRSLFSGCCGNLCFFRRRGRICFTTRPSVPALWVHVQVVSQLTFWST